MWISKNTTPFTDEQKELFERYRPYASKIASKFLVRRTGGGAEFCDDMKAAAMLGLLLATQRYDPVVNPVPFSHFAKIRIWATMVERTYENLTGAHCVKRNKARERILEAYARERPASDSWGDHAAVDDRDELDSVLCRISPRYARVMRKFFAGMEFTDIAADEWCCKAYAHDMAKIGLAEARAVVAGGPRLPPTLAPGSTLKIQDVMRMIGRKNWTVWRWIRRGEFPPPVSPSSRRGGSLWDRAEVEAWIARKEAS